MKHLLSRLLHLGAAASILALSATPAAAYDEYVANALAVILMPNETIEAFNARYGTTTLDSYPPADLYLVSTPEGVTVPEFDDLLEFDGKVKEADPSWIQQTPEGIRAMVISGTGNGPGEFHDQQAFTRVGVDLAHTVSTGAGVVIAVLDTGIDPNHSLLAGRIHPAAWDFVDEDPDPTDAGNGIDDDADGLTDEGLGHGTMVAGIIARIAPDAQILPLRVLDDEARGEAFKIAKALRYAADNGAHVVNMSLGGPYEIKVIRRQVDHLNEDRGIVLVSGAGNENRNTPPYFPAIQDEVIMVTALDAGDARASFADYHQDVAVAAPGVGIQSAFPGGSWALGDGSSFAVPFVTGEAALLLSRWPILTPEQVENIVVASVEPIYQIASNAAFMGQLGSGRIYLPNALLQTPAAVPGETGIASLLRAFPNPARGSVHLALDVEGPATVEILDVTGRRVTRFRAETSARWDGRDARGARVAPGLYFARIAETGGAATRIVLLD